MTQFVDFATYFKSRTQSHETFRRFTDDELEVVYGLARGLYERGEYEASARQFSFLSLYRPSCVRFLSGLGASQFMLRRFDLAVAAYSLVVLLEPHDAESLYAYGNALLMSGDHAAARSQLERVVLADGENHEFGARARALLRLMEALADGFVAAGGSVPGRHTEGGNRVAGT